MITNSNKKQSLLKELNLILISRQNGLVKSQLIHKRYSNGYRLLI